MSPRASEDEAWTQRVLDRLRNDLWNAQQTNMLEHLSNENVDAILNKLRDELWSTVMVPKDRDAWAAQIIGKLRDELWCPPGKAPMKKLTPDEEKRVEVILARLKQELWSP